MLKKIDSFYFIFLNLIILIIIRFIFFKIIVKLRMHKYIYKVELLIDDKCLKLKAFYDTGNNFVIGSFPVLFLKSKGNLKLGGISSFDSFYKKEFKKALLKYKDKKTEYIKPVLVSEVSEKEDFFGCDLLLNSSVF